MRGRVIDFKGIFGCRGSPRVQPIGCLSANGGLLHIKRWWLSKLADNAIITLWVQLNKQFLKYRVAIVLYLMRWGNCPEQITALRWSPNKSFSLLSLDFQKSPPTSFQAMVLCLYAKGRRPYREPGISAAGRMVMASRIQINSRDSQTFTPKFFLSRRSGTIDTQIVVETTRKHLMFKCTI